VEVAGRDTGDLVVFLDADLLGDVSHYVPGLLAPLLADPQGQLRQGLLHAAAGGRGPHPAGAAAGSPSSPPPAAQRAVARARRVRAALGGEYAGRRSAQEQVPFLSGIRGRGRPPRRPARPAGLGGLRTEDLGRAPPHLADQKAHGRMAGQVVSRCSSRSAAGVRGHRAVPHPISAARAPASCRSAPPRCPSTSGHPWRPSPSTGPSRRGRLTPGPRGELRGRPRPGCHRAPGTASSAAGEPRAGEGAGTRPWGADPCARTCDAGSAGAPTRRPPGPPPSWPRHGGPRGPPSASSCPRWTRRRPSAPSSGLSAGRWSTTRPWSTRWSSSTAGRPTGPRPSRPPRGPPSSTPPRSCRPTGGSRARARRCGRGCTPPAGTSSSSSTPTSSASTRSSSSACSARCSPTPGSATSRRSTTAR
jgi:hypothetical protein